MKRIRFGLLVGLIVVLSSLLVKAQADVKQYTSADVVWKNDATIDYTAGPKGANLFMSVTTDKAGRIYIANYSNILIVDAETGQTVGTIVDPSGTIQHYSDVIPLSDGNVWIADDRSSIYLVDPDGNILKTVPFHTSPGFQEMGPGDIELDNDGNLYASYASYGIHFQVFTPEGEYVRSIITGADKLTGVAYFTFDADNTLYFQGVGIGWITEEGDKAVSHEFAPEFMADQGFIQYRGIAVDADGNVYFSANASGDTGLLIYKLDADGNLIGQYGVGQARANWANAFSTDELGYAVTLALDEDGALIIADTNSTYSQLIKINMQEAES